MEPLGREAVRTRSGPLPGPQSPALPGHSPADCLTGGHRRQAGTPLGSSTHAQSHPGPRLSHSTPGSGHPVQPQRPGARTWRKERSRKGGSRATPCPHVGLPPCCPPGHSQRLHVGVLSCVPHLHRAVVGSAVELVGASSEGQSLERMEKGQRVWTMESRPREAHLKAGHMTQAPIPPPPQHSEYHRRPCVEPGTGLPDPKQLRSPQALHGSG